MLVVKYLCSVSQLVVSGFNGSLLVMTLTCFCGCCDSVVFYKCNSICKYSSIKKLMCEF